MGLQLVFFFSFPPPLHGEHRLCLVWVFAGSMLAPHWETWSRVLGGGTADTTHYVHWLLRVLRQLGMQPLFKLYSIASKYFAGNTSAILVDLLRVAFCMVVAISYSTLGC
ncbi:hypothetical protein BGW80DRAFT_1451307 [Lactifluus volemus]|nr:hypothetical protein BGW80DRAFT_1451307 [Lactifluus volemus]